MAAKLALRLEQEIEMNKQTNLCCAFIALFAAFSHGEAAYAASADIESKPEVHQKANEAKAEPPAPVVIEGDDISFDDTTGEVYAKGNVSITQLDASLTADDIRGNTKTADVWIDGKAHIAQPQLSLDGHDSYYNYREGEGSMRLAVGEFDKKYVRGENIEFYPEEIIIYNGTVTKCPATKPDYHISARKIEIWPDNKLVAYDAKFHIKGKVIYSMKRYETEIGANAKDNPVFPTIGYHSGDGVFVKQRLERSLSDNMAAYADLGYYSKHDFRGEFGVVNHNRGYTLSLHAGDFQDDDDEWIKKEPEVSLTLAEKRLWDTPFHYRASGSVGRWSDGDKRSWHQQYNVYFSREPIQLDPSLKLYLGAGYEFIKESYDGSKINTLTQDITLEKEFSPRLTAWTGYHYTKNDNERALFKYDTADVAKELASGFKYKLDDKNAIGVEQSYDLDNNRTVDMDYTWYRNVHCFDLELTYREKRDEWKVKANVAHW